MNFPIQRYNHTKDRLMERYNLSITEEEYLTLCKDLKNAQIIDVYSTNRDIRLFQFKGKNVYFGYNHQLELINTALPITTATNKNICKEDVFPNEQAAVSYMETMNKKDKFKNQFKTTYLCPICNKWHVSFKTSIEIESLKDSLGKSKEKITQLEGRIVILKNEISNLSKVLNLMNVKDEEIEKLSKLMTKDGMVQEERIWTYLSTCLKNKRDGKDTRLLTYIDSKKFAEMFMEEATRDYMKILNK